MSVIEVYSMNLFKFLLIGITLLLGLGAVFSVNLRSRHVNRTKPIQEFSEYLESGILNGITLTIYYMCTTIFSRPVSEDTIKERGWHEYKIEVRGSPLEIYIDLITAMYEYVPTPVEQESPFVDIRLLYVFENERGDSLFRVSMWGLDESMYVNGVEVKESDIFYDVIIPFLPLGIVKELEAGLNRNWIE